jgi:hypothetical protein
MQLTQSCQICLQMTENGLAPFHLLYWDPSIDLSVVERDGTLTYFTFLNLTSCEKCLAKKKSRLTRSLKP